MSSETPVNALEPPILLGASARAWLVGTFFPGADAAAGKIETAIEERSEHSRRRISARGLNLAIDMRHVDAHISDSSVTLLLDSNVRPGRARGIADQLERHGPEAGETELQLSGRYALIHIDLRFATLTLRTDRFAVVPLCYRIAGGSIAFSDRADAVAGRPESSLDPQAFFDYVHGHTIAAPHTIFHDVLRLEAGAGLSYGPKGSLEFRTWRPEFARTRTVDIAKLKSHFIGLLGEAIQRECTGQRLGCFLSGGTDSSTVVGMLARVSAKPVQSFSIGFASEGYDEMAYARIAARHFGADHHEHYVTPDELLEAIPAVAAASDQPFGNSSVVPAYCCARVAAKHGVERILAGDGGDELFGGNSRYARQKLLGVYGTLPGVLRRSAIEPLLLRTPLWRVRLVRRAASYVEQARTPMPERMEAHNLLDHFGPENVLTQAVLAHVDQSEPLELRRRVYGRSEGADLVNRMLAYDWRFTLADTDLPKVNWATRLAGLDVGFPLLGDELVDFSLELPVALKVRGMKLRWFFKEALKDFLPPEIIEKKKHGFGLPFGPWLLEHDGLRDLAHRSLRQLTERNVVQPALVKDLFSSRLQAHPGYYGEMVWILMMLEQWLSAHAPNFSVRAD